MSFIRRQKNQRGPNYSVGSTGSASPSQFPIRVTGAAGSAGGNSYTGGGGNNSGGSSSSSSCNGAGGSSGANSNSYTGGGPAGGGGGVASIFNGNTITIPYTNNGWYYNISIPPTKTEKVKVKPKDGRDGCDCVKCQSFFQFAEPNQEDGTLICWACRHGY